MGKQKAPPRTPIVLFILLLGVKPGSVFFGLTLFQVVGQVFYHVIFGLEDPGMALVVHPDIDFVNLNPSRPGVGVANDYPIVQPVLAEAKYVNVFRSHHRPDILLLISKIMFAHELLCSI
jgi:hypothetical protein